MPCFNNCLKLSGANTFKITSVRNLIDKARETTEFFNYSQKGNNVELFRKKLQDMCRTD